LRLPQEVYEKYTAEGLNLRKETKLCDRVIVIVVALATSEIWYRGHPAVKSAPSSTEAHVQGQEYFSGRLQATNYGFSSGIENVDELICWKYLGGTLPERSFTRLRAVSSKHNLTMGQLLP
jgi:hypothetical protein